MAQFYKAFVNKTLTANETLLYGLIFGLCCNDKKSCQKSINDLTNLFPAKVSSRTVIRTLESLEKRKVISVTRTGTFKNIYKILVEPEQLCLCQNVTNDNLSNDNMSQELVTKCHKSSDRLTQALVTDCHKTNDRLSPLIRSNIDLLIDRILDIFYREKSEKKFKNPTDDFFNPTLNLPTQEIVEFVVKEKQIKEVTKTAEDFLNYYKSVNWKNAKGLQITDWLAALNYWCSKAKEKEQQANAQPKFFKRDCDKSLEEFAEDGKKAYKRMFGIDLDDNSQVIDVTNQSENNNNQIPASILNFLNHEQQEKINK